MHQGPWPVERVPFMHTCAHTSTHEQVRAHMQWRRAAVRVAGLCQEKFLVTFLSASRDPHGLLGLFFGDVGRGLCLHRRAPLL